MSVPWNLFTRWVSPSWSNIASQQKERKEIKRKEESKKTSNEEKKRSGRKTEKEKKRKYMIEEKFLERPTWIGKKCEDLSVFLERSTTISNVMQDKKNLYGILRRLKRRNWNLSDMSCFSWGDNVWKRVLYLNIKYLRTYILAKKLFSSCNIYSKFWNNVHKFWKRK